ncbi:hypothetical protein BJX70DRAFT_180357 [Aspergillus crustosus]
MVDAGRALDSTQGSRRVELVRSLLDRANLTGLSGSEEVNAILHRKEMVSVAFHSRVRGSFISGQSGFLRVSYQRPSTRPCGTSCFKSRFLYGLQQQQQLSRLQPTLTGTEPRVSNIPVPFGGVSDELEPSKGVSFPLYIPFRSISGVNNVPNIVPGTMEDSIEGPCQPLHLHPCPCTVRVVQRLGRTMQLQIQY